MIDENHYNDDYIDVRNIPEFCLIVFTNYEGDTKVVSYESNFFTPHDLLEAYKAVFRDDWLMDDEIPVRVSAYKKYLMDTQGCTEEDFE